GEHCISKLFLLDCKTGDFQTSVVVIPVTTLRIRTEDHQGTRCRGDGAPTTGLFIEEKREIAFFTLDAIEQSPTGHRRISFPLIRVSSREGPATLLDRGLFTAFPHEVIRELLQTLDERCP